MTTRAPAVLIMTSNSSHAEEIPSHSPTIFSVLTTYMVVRTNITVKLTVMMASKKKGLK